MQEHDWKFRSMKLRASFVLVTTWLKESAGCVGLITGNSGEMSAVWWQVTSVSSTLLECPPAVIRTRQLSN